MNVTVFLQLQLKRLWKNKLFLLLLVAFPVCMYLLSRSFRGEEDSRIPVGLYLATEDSLAETLCEKLTTLDDSLFVFSYASSKDELLKSVQNNRFECGYLFEEPLGEQLNKSRLKNLITVYVSENTTCTGVLNELVYANLFEEYALSLLQDSFAEAGHLPFTEEEASAFELPPVTKETVEPYYRTHLSDGSTFRIEVRFVSETGSAPLTGTSSASRPFLRGLVSLFLLLCGFLALLTVYHDKQNGLYARLYGKMRTVCPWFTMTAYLLPSGLVCLLSLGISGCLTNLGTELLALLCYVIAILVFYTILGTLLRSHTVLCAALPMILLCTLIFTPVITDLSAFFPWISVVRYVLPTHYYLLFF